MNRTDIPTVFRHLIFTTTGLCVLMNTGTSAQNPPQAPAPRTAPPVIILKLDDLSQQNGAIVPNFVRIAGLLKERNVKAGFGLICAVTWPGADPLSESGPAYIEQVKKWHRSGLFEIWFHGWDHAGHKVDGENCCEFYGRSFEEQKQRFDRAQAVAQEKLGFVFTTFGAGGCISKHPSWDETTRQVVAQAPHITAWFRGKRDDATARELREDDRVAILDRVPGVSLERKVGKPDFERFLKNYRKHPERDCFVLQGHPNPWDDAGFAEVMKIVDFLIAEGAVFMTPSEYAAGL